MAEGQRAADQTKSAFHQISDATEGIRKNINSAADNLIGGNKTHGGTGVHPDARKTGEELAKGAGKATAAVENMVNQQKNK